MAQGSGSAYLLCIILFVSTGAQAATYVVGGSAGWTFNTNNWPKGKRFAAGDLLIFKYNPALHNVVAVNRAEHNQCSATPRARPLQSGNDKIKLVKGQNYFICSIAGHCDSFREIIRIKAK